MTPPPPRFTLFPYTTLFRSRVHPASIFLGLAGRQPAISPACLLAPTPSRRASVAIAIGAVFVAVARFPASMIVVKMLIAVVLPFSLSVPRHRRWRDER